MAEKHRLLRIEGDIMTLDNLKRYKADAFGVSTLSSWSQHLDEVEVEDSGFSVKITHLKRGETVNVQVIPGQTIL